MKVRVKKQKYPNGREVCVAIEGIVQKHGWSVVRWAFNKLSNLARLRGQLQREKRRIEVELARVEAKIR